MSLKKVEENGMEGALYHDFKTPLYYIFIFHFGVYRMLKLP